MDWTYPDWILYPRRRHGDGGDVEGLRNSSESVSTAAATTAHDIGAGGRLRADRQGVSGWLKRAAPGNDGNGRNGLRAARDGDF
jgi:hypothetical protein